MRETKRDGKMHSRKKEDTMIVESITLLHFKWPKKLHSYMNVYFIRFDWNRRACLVCSNVLCAVSFWAKHMCCLFRFYHFRIVFIWFGRLCVSSAHIIVHADICVLCVSYYDDYYYGSVLLRFGWTSEIITFKPKLYLGYIISVNILLLLFFFFSFREEKRAKNATKFFHRFLHLQRPPHSHNSGRYFLE